MAVLIKIAKTMMGQNVYVRGWNAALWPISHFVELVHHCNFTAYL